ncbi:MAG TPA: hypothetical protein P5572_02665 [Phycisphaerae bacterium]|nr:hypothetical protein [Phycisphaerales bacterium]HRX83902.1 hypothetical protein [Phycisphaerae bacterium]
MSKRSLITRSEFTAWLRRLRMAVMAYVGVILLVAAIFILARLLGADVGLPFVGVTALFAGLVLGAVTWAGLWLADVVHAQAAQLEKQREQIALLESSLQMLEVDIEQKTAATHAALLEEKAERESSLLRIATRPEPTPRYAPEPPAPPEPAPPVAKIEPVEAPEVEVPEVELPEVELPEEPAPVVEIKPSAPPPDQPEVTERSPRVEVPEVDKTPVSPPPDPEPPTPQPPPVEPPSNDRLADAAALRDEFAALVQSAQFAAAIRKGEEIVALVPDSRMAHDFNLLRPHLEARAAEAGDAADR